MHLAKRRNVGHAVEKDNSRDQLFGVLHFVDGAFFDFPVQLTIAPVIAHLRMDHVLIDRGQFVGQEAVERFDTF